MPLLLIPWRAGARAIRAPTFRGPEFADIPGALSDPASPYPFTLPAAEHFAAAAGRLGVGDATHVVAYAQDVPMWATQLWWLLRYFGHDDTSVPDGGLPEWGAHPELPWPPADAPGPRPGRAERSAISGGDDAKLVHALPRPGITRRPLRPGEITEPPPAGPDESPSASPQAGAPPPDADGILGPGSDEPRTGAS